MKTSPNRLLILLLAAALLSIAGTSCNTARGFGRDVEHVGGHIEEAASR